MHDLYAFLYPYYVQKGMYNIMGWARVGIKYFKDCLEHA
jgi:hypothetical protein